MGFRMTLAGALAVGLVGCSGGGDGSDPICDVLAGGGSTTTSSSTGGMAISNAGAVFDGNTGTAASLSTTLSGTATFRGKAQPGVVVPGGRVAGVALDTPTDGSIVYTISTYLDGVLQERSSVNNETYSSGGTSSQQCADYCVNRGNGTSYVGLTTSQAFDEIEVGMDVTNAGDDIRVRELCLETAINF